MILHIFMYNVMSGFSGARRASEGRVNTTEACVVPLCVLFAFNIMLHAIAY